MLAFELIPAIITVSEKSANIARLCRQDEQLLSYLVQEKKEGEKNPRFIADFKTLADVVVQELVKHDLGLKFPALQDHIYGEETNEFSTDGETIIVEVKNDPGETSELLSKILGDKEASEKLANVIHSDIELDFSSNLEFIPKLPDKVGIWIDPIDATSEYIRGGQKDENGLPVAGLPCVTVLIGAFNLETGAPIIGVINQPFHSRDMETESWIGRYIFGVSYNGVAFCSPQFPADSEKVVAISSSESKQIKNALSSKGYKIIEIAGAGYKLMNVITGNAQAYILSKPTSYLWDICACHAILESMGGGIIDFTNLTTIKYKAGHGIKNCCNSGGIIAYRNEAIKEDIIEVLKLCPK